MPFPPGGFQADRILPGRPSWKPPGRNIRTRQPGSFQADRILPGGFQACDIREIGADARRYPTCRAAMFQEDCRKDPEHRILPGISQEGPCFQVAAKPCTCLVLQNLHLPAWKLPGSFQEVSRNLPGRIQENARKSRKGALSRRTSFQETSWKDIRISFPAFF